VALSNDLLIAEYNAIRGEMNSITTSRYTVLALTITGIGAIFAAVLNVGHNLTNPEVLAPLAIAVVLFPSTIVSVTLSRQFHRLSSYNVVFGSPLIHQQLAFEIYGRRRPHHWAFVKPLAFTYAWLLAGSAALLLSQHWSLPMLVSVALLVCLHIWPIANLWGASLTGDARKADIELWAEIRQELDSRVNR
jgi:hypothetical protein